VISGEKHMNDQRRVIEEHVAGLVAKARTRLSAANTSPAQLAAAIAQTVPLAAIVSNADPKLRAFEANDGKAFQGQERFARWGGSRAQWTALGGALISAAALLPQWLTSLLPHGVISGAQFLMALMKSAEATKPQTLLNRRLQRRPSRRDEAWRATVIAKPSPAPSQRGTGCRRLSPSRRQCG
jgi:hypothetical protein